MYVCMYVSMCVCMYVCIYVCMYVRMYVCMYWMYVCINVCLHLCMYVCLYVYMYIMHIYIYVYIYTWHVLCDCQGFSSFPGPEKSESFDEEPKQSRTMLPMCSSWLFWTCEETLMHILLCANGRNELSW